MKFNRIAKIAVIAVISVLSLQAQTKFNESNSKAGAFSRMGFGARGVGMGNALSAVNEGVLSSYYNPALMPFQNGNTFTSGYSFLSLDRALNFVSFSRKFEFYSAKDSANPNRKPRSTAGVSIGVINSGVSKIDGRDNQGMATGDLSTSENQFFLSVSNKFSDKFSVGLTAKLYYYKLYEQITASGLGFDLGVLYSFTPNLKAAFVLVDLNSKYKWDSAPVYSTDGTSTTDDFPVIKKLAVSYTLPQYKLLLAAEYQFDNYSKKLARLGAEYCIAPNMAIRGGLDNAVLDDIKETIRPSLGFSYSTKVSIMELTFDYSYQYEQFSKSDRHTIGLNIIF